MYMLVFSPFLRGYKLCHGCTKRKFVLYDPYRNSGSFKESMNFSEEKCILGWCYLGWVAQGHTEGDSDTQGDCSVFVTAGSLGSASRTHPVPGNACCCPHCASLLVHSVPYAEILSTQFIKILDSF